MIYRFVGCWIILFISRQFYYIIRYEQFVYFSILFLQFVMLSERKFIKAWDSIPDENKKNINIRAAVGITCIKLSDDLFYKDFDLSEDCLIESKKIDIVLNVDDIFSCTVYEGYEKIIQEQDDELKQPYTADELIDILKEKIVVFGEPVSFGKFATNSISVVMAFADPKVIEGKYKVIRDLLAKYGWYMSIKQDYIKNGEPTGFIQLVFELTQIPKVTVDVRKENKTIYHLTKIKSLDSIRKNGLVPSNKNKEVLYTEDHIYFLKESVTDNNFKKMIETICKQKSIKKDNSKICCLVINVSKIPDNVDFYYDSHVSYGLFATDTIPYSAVEHIYTYDKKSNIIEIRLSEKSFINTVIQFVKKVFSTD